MEILHSNIKKSKKSKNLVYISIILILIFFTLIVPDFLSISNLVTILITMSIISILGMGVTFVLAAGEIDISTGALMSVPAVILGKLLSNGFSLWISLLVALLSALFIGFLNGFVTTKIGLPSFITTLGTSGISMGLSRVISNNTPILVQNKFISTIFAGSLLGVPKLVIWMFALAILGFVVLNKMQLGRNLQCIGDNREAAFSYGININRSITLAFMISSLYVFFAGILIVARTSYATPGVGESLVLSAIVAPVIGGNPIQGGKSNIINTLIGAFFLSLISNGLFALNFPSWTSNIVIGIVILVVLTINSLRQIYQREMERF
ncbi:ABC transporter permease [Thermoanaerobacter pentosaceus]|uniref:Ribose/xylose/arabinose/galactoside ABC-type transport system permease subunit n=1 Tax=Thermoanaerobacter pentosaceus TaxID=694059 RepID=A0ABT9M6F8_9THEO|nr:ABC transporter permease [Thermoanaerobacter pentosaceus]MDP9751465.1 ribose/xylose/arabinose/galactoside ABC-type transport system permease subunit [Thermoanaerobacter pentosaceus]